MGADLEDGARVPCPGDLSGGMKVRVGQGYAWQTFEEGEELDSGKVLVKRDV